jgi:hypothetical protein
MFIVCESFNCERFKQDQCCEDCDAFIEELMKYNEALRSYNEC